MSSHPAAPRRAARTSARVRGAARATAVAAGAVTLVACDPCAGVASCTQRPRLGVSGQIVDWGEPTQGPRESPSGAGIPSPRPVSGVRVEVIPTGGVAQGVPSAAATTDGSGWWAVSIPVPESGGASADVVVTPPAGPGYRVNGLILRANDARGEGNVLGRWTHQPYMAKLGEVIDWPSGFRREGARVTPTRVGGVEVAPTRNTRTPLVTVSGGLFLFDVRPLAYGPLVVDFVVERDGLPPATVRGVTIFPQYEWLPPQVDGALSFRLDAAGARAP